jgi:hypothetical protein
MSIGALTCFTAIASPTTCISKFDFASSSAIEYSTIISRFVLSRRRHCAMYSEPDARELETPLDATVTVTVESDRHGVVFAVPVDTL